ncbi:unnamed protein product, partial [Ectocarpus sp. 4 AP-2014]
RPITPFAPTGGGNIDRGGVIHFHKTRSALRSHNKGCGALGWTATFSHRLSLVSRDSIVPQESTNPVPLQRPSLHGECSWGLLAVRDAYVRQPRNPLERCLSARTNKNKKNNNKRINHMRNTHRNKIRDTIRKLDAKFSDILLGEKTERGQARLQPAAT